MDQKDTLEARIHAEALVKAACIQAATQLIISGKQSVSPNLSIEKNVAYVALSIWAELEKPHKWPS